VQSGIHHRPSRGCGCGATRTSMRGTLRDGDSGQLENQSISNAEGLGIQGDLEICPSARQGSEEAGQPEESPLAEPEGAGPWETRQAASRCRKIPEAGKPEQGIIGDTERPGAGATRSLASRHRRRMRESRRLEEPSPAKAGGCVSGATRVHIEGAAGGVRKRGDPGTHSNRQRRGMEGSGQPGRPSPA